MKIEWNVNAVGRWMTSDAMTTNKKQMENADVKATDLQIQNLGDGSNCFICKGTDNLRSKIDSKVLLQRDSVLRFLLTQNAFAERDAYFLPPSISQDATLWYCNSCVRTIQRYHKYMVDKKEAGWWLDFNTTNLQKIFRNTNTEIPCFSGALREQLLEIFLVAVLEMSAAADFSTAANCLARLGNSC
eukprot:g14787.t1